MLNSTPLSTPPTPISGHKVHFHLNCSTDDEDSLTKPSPLARVAPSEQSSNFVDRIAHSKTTANAAAATTTTAVSEARSIVKNSNNMHASHHHQPSAVSQSAQNNPELLLEWESYWDTLEYNCLGRTNIDF